MGRRGLCAVATAAGAAPASPRISPICSNKPVDAPYGPYADDFGEKQHKYGPFGPIRDAIKKLKSAASRKP